MAKNDKTEKSMDELFVWLICYLNLIEPDNDTSIAKYFRG